jgi:hypothetical protein
MAAICMAVIAACNDESGAPALSMLTYTSRADQICLLNFHRGLRGERAVEQQAKTRRWRESEVEARIRYAWADAMEAEFRMIQALGQPPVQATLFRRWHKTALERSRIYDRWGDAWAASNRALEAGIQTKLDLAKTKADQLAQRLPFRVCGTPANFKQPDRQELLRDPALLYTAELPLGNRGLLHKGLRVYWLHHVAGRVVDQAPGAATMLVELRMKRAYARRMIGSQLQLFRSHRDPSKAWLAMIPKRNRQS